MKRYPANTAIIGALALLIGVGGSPPNALAGEGACTFCTNCPDGMTACFPSGTPVSACLDLGCGADDTSEECAVANGGGCPTSEVGQCDDGVNNDAWVNDLTDCDDPACATDPVCLMGVVVTVPSDLNPGDQYRLMFVTDGQIDAESTDITVYNAVVAGDAAAVAELAALGATWTAMASTPTVAARDNTGTDPTPAGDTGVPVYLVDGTRVADNYDMLWLYSGAGPLLAPPNVTASGGAPPRDRVWTGSGTGGTQFEPLGGTDEGNLSVVGNPVRTNASYLAANENDQSNERPLYGLSSVLTFTCVENITQGTSPATIQDALNAAANGDVIELGACTFFEDNLTIPDDVQLTLQGAGMHQTFIDGGSDDAARVFLLSNSGQTSDTVIADLTISTSGGASAVRLNNTSPIFRRVRFYRCTNSALDDRGGATYDKCVFTECGGFQTVFKGGGTSQFLQCLFHDNATSWELIADGASATLVNCTFDADKAWSVRAGSQVDVFNTASTGTFALAGSGVLNSTGSVYPGATGDNIDGLPTFEDAAGGDYRLAPGSLGIDAADITAFANAGGGATDLNGDPRTHDDTGTPDTGSGAPPYLDMGAYEFQGTTVPGECNGDGTIDLDDYDDFETCLLGPGGGLGIDCNCFDFDHDGDVTLPDYAAFQASFTE